MHALPLSSLYSCACIAPESRLQTQQLPASLPCWLNCNLDSSQQHRSYCPVCHAAGLLTIKLVSSTGEQASGILLAAAAPVTLVSHIASVAALGWYICALTVMMSQYALLLFAAIQIAW